MSMKSNGSSSTSEGPNSRVPKPWLELLESQEELERLRGLHNSSLWDSLKDLLWAERLFHLEALAETDNEEHAKEHRWIARYLRHFVEAIPERVEIARQAAEAKSRGDFDRPDPDAGGSPYMEGDGGPETPIDVD